MNLQNARRALKQEDNRDFNFKPELVWKQNEVEQQKRNDAPKRKKKDKAKNALQGCHVKDKAWK